jgi:hypothetical protein
LKKKHGISIVNLELLLSSFIRLGILSPENLIGEDYLFLRKDYFLARLPPEYSRSEEVLGDDGPEYIAEVQEFFSTYVDTILRPVPQYFYSYFKDPAFSLMQELASRPLNLDDAIDFLKGDEDLFLSMQEHKLITMINGRVFLLAGLFFIPIFPFYIIGELRQKVLEQQKPIEVLMRQMEIIVNEIS